MVMRDAAVAGLDGGQELDIAEVCKTLDAPQPGSLLDVSISAIRGERALRVGDSSGAGKLWAAALAPAIAGGYRLVAIDALEALGCLAVSKSRLELAATLLASAQAERQAIGYWWRFPERQRSLSAATTVLEAHDDRRSGVPALRSGAPGSGRVWLRGRARDVPPTGLRRTRPAGVGPARPLTCVRGSSRQLEGL